MAFDDENGKHFSAKEAARFCYDQRIGRRYSTVGQVWDIPTDTRTIGLLELIYECVSKRQEPTDSERLEAHAMYVKFWFKHDSKMIQTAMNQIYRLTNMCHGVTSFLRIEEFEWFFECCNIHSLSSTFVECATTRVEHNHYHYKTSRLETFIDTISRIRSADGFTKFSGFGKRSLQKLKAEIAEAKRKKTAK